MGVLGAVVLALLMDPALLASAPRVVQAPDAPGIDAVWDSGAKQGLGTSTSTTSPLWYTLGNGITTEVYYPQVDTPDVHDLQCLVTDGSGFTDQEKADTTHAVALDDSRTLSYRQTNSAHNGRYRITKTYATDPARPTLLVQTRFEVLSGGPLRLYVLYNPSLNGRGMGDTGATDNGMLMANDGPVASALAASTGFSETTSGYSGTASDGFQDLTAHHRLSATYARADDAGNLVQTAQIPVGSDTVFTLALGFGPNRDAAAANAAASLSTGWGAVSGSFRAGWHTYLDSLPPAPASVSAIGAGQVYDTARMVLAAHEDKNRRGAFIASLTVPWGQAVNADTCCAPGYHAVWARDLYEIATAEIALGDAGAAGRALDYLLNTQERPDGSFPQNSRLDGTAVFGSLQLDEVADPILLAWQLHRSDAGTWPKLKAAAEFLSHHGPGTPEERWEEAGGYSPSTLAAEIAGLVCAADLATANHDPGAASYYLQVADSWQRQVEAWTFTTTGSLAAHGYYERIDDNGNPNDGHRLTVANGGGDWDERDVVDAGFLELVRLGVRAPQDPHITDSLPVIDATIRTSAPEGDLWHRYNHDGYGETTSGAPYTGQGVGRAWPVLTGERGEYELAAGDSVSAQARLATLAGAANAGGLIPEQVWDQPDDHGFALGGGTDSATPLAWAEAQFVRLAVSISAGHDLDTPSIVAQRYLK